MNTIERAGKTFAPNLHLSTAWQDQMRSCQAASNLAVLLLDSQRNQVTRQIIIIRSAVCNVSLVTVKV